MFDSEDVHIAGAPLMPCSLPLSSLTDPRRGRRGGGRGGGGGGGGDPFTEARHPRVLIVVAVCVAPPSVTALRDARLVTEAVDAVEPDLSALGPGAEVCRPDVGASQPAVNKRSRWDTLHTTRQRSSETGTVKSEP